MTTAILILSILSLFAGLVFAAFVMHSLSSRVDALEQQAATLAKDLETLATLPAPTAAPGTLTLQLERQVRELQSDLRALKAAPVHLPPAVDMAPVHALERRVSALDAALKAKPAAPVPTIPAQQAERLIARVQTIKAGRQALRERLALRAAQGKPAQRRAK